MDQQSYMKQLTSPIPKEISAQFQKATIGIAGAGGLGSNIAVALVRSGVSKLIIADFDRVDIGNLNRQYFFYEDVGSYKVDALKQHLLRINPYLDITIYPIKLTLKNYDSIFAGCSIVAEAFDNPDAKGELVNHFLTQHQDIKIVSASGMAGIFSANLIKTRKINSRLYLCGDCSHEVTAETGVFAPRVAIAAAHQANMILQLILDKEDI